jgi:peptidyl-tRNA hydrolase
MFNEIELESRTYIYLINTDVPMSAGKVAAQVSNVACQLPRLPDSENKLMDNVSRTYVFSSTEKYMLWLIKKFSDFLDIKWTVDSGSTTEFTYGCLTCVGWKRKDPLWKIFTNHLKLYGKDYS